MPGMAKKKKTGTGTIPLMLLLGNCLSEANIKKKKKSNSHTAELIT